VRRHSTQREFIDEALHRAPGPLSADEVRARLSQTGVGLATVYRTLRAGVERGELRQVDLPNQPSRFEPADRPHHHHFACKGCGHVFDIDVCPGDLSPYLPDGFLLDRHELTLHGTCPDCPPAEATP